MPSCCLAILMRLVLRVLTPPTFPAAVAWMDAITSSMSSISAMTWAKSSSLYEFLRCSGGRGLVNASSCGCGSDRADDVQQADGRQQHEPGESGCSEEQAHGEGDG